VFWFEQKFATALEDAIEFHAFAPLEANMHACDQCHSSRVVTLLPVDAVNSVQTLKAWTRARCTCLACRKGGCSPPGSQRSSVICLLVHLHVFEPNFSLEAAIDPTHVGSKPACLGPIAYLSGVSYQLPP